MKEPKTQQAAKQRLDKTVSSQTEFSRSEAKNIIRKGLVQRNGSLCKNPDCFVDWNNDSIIVNGKELYLKQHIYLMLYKPKGVVSATEDSRFPTVLRFVPAPLWRKGLFPAGRLDKDTTGFVLLTDDGAFAHDILSPRKHISKTYEASIDGTITPEMISAFASGVDLGSERTLPAQLTRRGSTPSGELATVVLREGMYHQIKRMFEAFGRNVLELHRAKMGNLALDPALKPGDCRELTAEELEQIQEHENKRL